jgi:hypothetical protein
MRETAPAQPAAPAQLRTQWSVGEAAGGAGSPLLPPSLAAPRFRMGEAPLPTPAAGSGSLSAGSAASRAARGGEPHLPPQLLQPRSTTAAPTPSARSSFSPLSAFGGGARGFGADAPGNAPPRGAAAGPGATTTAAATAAACARESGDTLSSASAYHAAASRDTRGTAFTYDEEGDGEASAEADDCTAASAGGRVGVSSAEGGRFHGVGVADAAGIDVGAGGGGGDDGDDDDDGVASEVCEILGRKRSVASMGAASSRASGRPDSRGTVAAAGGEAARASPPAREDGR